MATIDDPNYRRMLIVEHEALKWIDDKDNWKKWSREMRFHWWKAHFLVRLWSVNTMAASKIKVGPLSGSESYVYRIGNRISEAKYHNAASAWADARRPQRVNTNGRLEPDTDDTDED